MRKEPLFRLLEVADAFLKKKASIGQLREAVKEAKKLRDIYVPDEYHRRVGTG